MSYTKLRNVSKFLLPLGLTFLAVGIILFMTSESGSMPEKAGVVFMIYSSIFLGIGFTALIALKSP